MLSVFSRSVGSVTSACTSVPGVNLNVPRRVPFSQSSSVPSLGIRDV